MAKYSISPDKTPHFGGQLTLFLMGKSWPPAKIQNWELFGFSLPGKPGKFLK
jgi:hypothetical protein